MGTYTGTFPNVKTHCTHVDVVAGMNSWATKIANDNSYHYKIWRSNDAKTKECPICKNYPKDKPTTDTHKSILGYHGWNCIGFAFAVWHHGGQLNTACNCHVIADDTAVKIYKAKTDAEALQIAKKFIKTNDLKIIRGKDGKDIPKSQWKAGDIMCQFKGNTYTHMFYYRGNGKVTDSTGSNGTKAVDKQIATRDYKNYTARIIFRYTGNGDNYRNYMKMGDSGEEVKKLQKFLNWAINAKLTVDGKFGEATDTAVRVFQIKCQLPGGGDGLFGEASLKAAKKFNRANKGIDISTWQGKISVDNFKKAKSNGIDYVILRLGYTGSSTKKPTLDDTFEHNYANAIKAGFPIGIYYYSRATTKDMAEKEAKFCIKYLKDKEITYPVYIDMEDDVYQIKCSKTTLASVCNVFCDTITKVGYIAGVYAGLNWFNNKIGKITSKHSKWVAQYYKECQYKGAYDMWQYTSTEDVIGISKNTDVSLCYKDFNKPIVISPVKIDDSVTEQKKEPTKYSGTLPSLTLKKSNAEVINDAVKWAVWIAGDNTFHYGYTNKSKTINAHHNGCYFCKTNTDKGGRSKKGIVDYKHTYCCNPFVHAAWAHGGCVPKALEICEAASSWDFVKGKGYDASKLFDNLGHPAQSKLKKGDVLCRDTHVALYIGNGKIAEASGGDDNKKGSTKWNNSIRVRTLTSDNYRNFPRVHRFNSSVNATMVIRHGEVSERVKQWQMFLNWYFDGKVGTPDGYFGDNTLKWTKKFQEEVIGKGQGDGLVGNKTLTAAKTVKK